MDGLPIRGVIWLVGLLIINAIVEAMVTAYESVSEAAVEKRLEEGEKKAKQVQYLLEHHRRYITVTDMLRLVAESIHPKKGACTASQGSDGKKCRFWDTPEVFLRPVLVRQHTDGTGCIHDKEVQDK